MKIATYNINSIRNRLPCLLEWLDAAQPDAVCLQELRIYDEEFPRAESLYGESLAILRELGDRQGIAAALGNLGHIAHAHGDLACARAAHAALGVQVRCAPGSWDENQGEEDADRWIRIDSDGESEIIWRTG